MNSNHYTNQVRLRNPGLARKADYGNSPISAIKLNCKSCVETKADIRDCTAYACPFWKYRPYQEGVSQDDRLDHIPSEAELMASPRSEAARRSGTPSSA